MWILLKWQERKDSFLWLLVPLGFLWANLHGSFILLFLLAGSAFVFGHGDKKKLFLMGFLTLAVTFITPRGFVLWQNVIETFTAPGIRDLSPEWLPPLNVGWQESVAKEVIRKLKDRLESLIVGDPMDKNTDIGAINSKSQLDIINKYIGIGKKEGAEMYQSSCRLPGKGFFCRPTLFTNVAQSNRIAQEEIFGPVLAILTFRTEDEVIEKANNSPYGLSAGVWTDKGSKIFNMTKRMKAGVVWANTFNKFDPTSPFGGYKESGFGREGGLHGLLPYLNLKN